MYIAKTLRPRVFKRPEGALVGCRRLKRGGGADAGGRVAEPAVGWICGSCVRSAGCNAVSQYVMTTLTPGGRGTGRVASRASARGP